MEVDSCPKEIEVDSCPQEREVDSCSKEIEVDSCPNQQDMEPCCSQNDTLSDSKNHAVKVPIEFHFDSRNFESSYERRNLSRLLNTARSRNLPRDDVTSLCRQMEDMNAHKGFKPCEKERKKRILERLRKLVDSYKNKKHSEDEDD